MGIPFARAKHLWKYLADQNQLIFLNVTSRATTLGKATKKEPRTRCDSYPYNGPLGSRGPILTVRTEHLYNTLNDPICSMQKKRKENNLYKWFMARDAKCQPYKPARRAARLRTYRITR